METQSGISMTHLFVCRRLYINFSNELDLYSFITSPVDTQSETLKGLFVLNVPPTRDKFAARKLTPCLSLPHYQPCPLLHAKLVSAY
jgi:hypothetical protein